MRRFKQTAFLMVIAMLMVAAAACSTVGQAVDTLPSASLATASSAALSEGAVSYQPVPSSAPISMKSEPAKKGTKVITEASSLISKITVTFYGDASISKGFTWYTNGDSQSSDVQVVERKAEQMPDFSRAMTFKGTVSKSHNSPDEVVHKASATGLTSNTAYYYRVGDVKLNIWSDPAVVTTAPESGPFTFIDLSDTQFAGQAGATVTADTISKALSQAKNAGFVVHNGDVVDNKSEEQWNLLLQTAKSSLMNTTIMPASGNHDSGNSTFIDHFNLDIPRSTATTGAYYSVDYGNAHFVVLNTNESSGNYKEFTNVQVDWLKSDIESAKNAGAQWIIVVMHMGPYTIAEHSSDSNVKDTRAKIAPLFNELGVDLVLQGHDHVYERSKPIVNGAAVGKTTVMGLLNSRPFEYIIDPKGPIYLTPGTAGTKHYYQNPGLSKDYLNLFDVASGPYKGDLDIENQETFMGITVDGDTLTATAYQISKTKNGGEPYIIDQFGIKKKV
jgi:predicted phosphodiesterase